MLKINIFIHLCLIFFLSLVFSNTIFQEGLVGNDFGYYIPIMTINKAMIELKGYIPNLFTPNICAGFVSFANPQDLFISIKQIIFNIFSQDKFLLVIFFSYSLIGFAGSYLLFLKVFEIDKNISYMGSYFFIFSGFFLSRYAAGHLGFLDFSFLPLIAYLIIRSTKTSNKFGEFSLVIISGIILASIIYSGSIAIYPNIILGLIAIMVIYYCKFHQIKKILVNLVLAVLLGILISIFKIYLFLNLMESIPRELDPVQLEDFFSYIKLVLNSFTGYANFFSNIEFNKSISVEFQETNYGLSIVLILFCLTLLNLNFLKKYYLTYLGILISFCFIGFISVSFYAYKFIGLDQMTIIPWRFFNILLMPLILMSLMNLENSNFYKLNNKYIKLTFTNFVLIVFLMLQFFLIQNQFEGNYKINKEMENFKLEPVNKVAAFIDKKSNNLIFPILRNDLILNNASTLNCYEPLHGYQNEKMKIKNFNFTEIKEYPSLKIFLLNPLDLNQNYYGFYKPSCFLFPEENSCKPYDTFKKNELNDLKSFLSYEKINFVEGKYFKISLFISLITLIGSIFYLIAYIFWRILLFINNNNGAGEGI